MKSFREEKIYTVKYHTNEEEGKIECRTFEEFIMWRSEHRNKESLIIDDIWSVTRIIFKKTLADRIEDLAERIDDLSYKFREKFEKA